MPRPRRLNYWFGGPPTSAFEMPLYSYDPGEFEELRSSHENYEAYRTRSGSEPKPFPEGDYVLDVEGDHVKYEPASVTFTPADLDGHARVTYDELLARGAFTVVGSYDGGGDEIFTRLDQVTVGENEWGREEARTRRAGGRQPGQLRPVLGPQPRLLRADGPGRAGGVRARRASGGVEG